MDDTILDFGCGSGILVSRLADAGYRVAGFDIAPTMDENEDTRLSLLPNYRGVANKLKENASFNCVIASEIYEHILAPDLEVLTEEWVKLLKNNGKLIVTVPHEENLAGSTCLCPNCMSLFHRWQHQRRVSAKELRSRFESFGLETIHTGAYDFSSNRELLNTGIRYQQNLENIKLEIASAIEASDFAEYSTQAWANSIEAEIIEIIESNLTKKPINDSRVDYREGAGQILLYVGQKIV